MPLACFSLITVIVGSHYQYHLWHIKTNLVKNSYLQTKLLHLILLLSIKSVWMMNNHCIYLTRNWNSQVPRNCSLQTSRFCTSIITWVLNISTNWEYRYHRFGWRKPQNTQMLLKFWNSYFIVIQRPLAPQTG